LTQTFNRTTDVHVATTTTLTLEATRHRAWSPLNGKW